MRLGLGLIALGISIMILGNQASHHPASDSTRSSAASAVSYRSISKQELGADVVEFFWYGCPHCLKLERSLLSQSFHATLSATTLDGQYAASFRRVPAVLNEEWALDARLFYALDNLGMTDEGHAEIMSIISSERPHSREQMLKLLNEKILPAITSGHLLASSPSASEIDLDMFDAITDRKIQDSIDLGKRINLTGVPIMVVGGDKVVSLGSDASYETMGPGVLSLLKSPR